jgi:hypothetical protein
VYTNNLLNSIINLKSHLICNDDFKNDIKKIIKYSKKIKQNYDKYYANKLKYLLDINDEQLNNNQTTDNNLISNDNQITDNNLISNDNQTTDNNLISNDNQTTDNNLNIHITSNEGYVVLQYSNCYGNKPLFYFIICIDYETYYVPLCYYNDTDEVKNNLSTFYCIQKCKIIYDVENMILKKIIVGDQNFEFETYMYNNLYDNDKLKTKKLFILDEIETKINNLINKIKDNDVIDDEIYGIKFSEICKNIDKDEKDSIKLNKNIRKYLSTQLNENNNKMLKLLDIF